MLILANKGLFDGAEHEYYLLVDGGKKRMISATTQVSSEVVLSPKPPAKKAAPKAVPKEEPSILDQIAVKIKNLPGWDEIKVEGTTKAVVDKPEELPKVEGILNAYFAKEEFTKETSDSAGDYVYTFGGTKANNKTGTAAEKAKVANAILTKGKINEKLKPEKRYTNKEAIIEALTKVEYGKDTTDAKTVEIKTFKLGANFIKINSAPLEEEVYVVANTYLLDGKEVSIKIREKEAVLVAADADLPVLEAKENGAELTTLKAVVEKGIAKVKIKLRPKSDDDLKTWKEKLANGIKDGTHKYTVKNTFTVSGDLDKIAGNIEKRSNASLAPTHIVKKADIVGLLAEGATYNNTNSFEFPKYKKEKISEMLWLKAECQGTKKYEEEFLKKEGSYFVVGGKCPRCEALVTAKDFNEMFPAVTQLFQRGTNTLTSTTIDVFLEVLNKTLKEFKINTCIKKAFFLTQIAKETGYFSRIDENLYYTTEEALHSFWSKTSHPKLYLNPSDFYKDPEKLGNYVYRDVAENGDEQSGDGYKFRGRGLIQITRKKGYRRFGEFSGKDLTTNPDLLLEDLDLMTRSAGWYWKHGVLLNNGTEKDLNTVAEKGDFKETTRLIHGSTDDVSARGIILSKIKKVLKTDECQKSGNVDIEYHIQSSGEIQYKIQNEKREMAEYFYHDNTGIVHNLGKFKLNKVKENYGGNYKDELGKDTENVYLIDIRIVNKNYNSNGKNFTLTVNTSRYYMNDVTMASLYGAMLDCGYDDFVFNGFSNEKGESVGGSKSHKNGMNGDLRYLRTDKKGGTTDLFNSSEETGWKGLDEVRQNSFNDALHKFGWKSMLSQSYGENKEKLLNKCTNDSDNNHNDHLHIQGYAPTLKEI